MKKGTLGVAVAVLLLAGLSGCGGGKGGLSVMDMLKTMQSAKNSKIDGPTAEMKKIMQGVDDTARIVFVSMIENQAQICTIQPDGQGFKQLTDTEGYKCRPAWSLDHKSLAFFQYPPNHPTGDAVNVMLMAADGTNSRELLSQKHIDTKKTRIGWKADGSIVFVQEKDFPSVLFGYSVATGQQVDTIRLPKQSFIKEAQTLSPDLELIAGTGPDAQTGLLHMGAVRRSSGEDLDFMKFFQQTPFHLGTVVWSYDSQFVAYELDVTVVIMSSTYNPKSFRFYSLTPTESDAQYSSPAFSPQGKYIACISEFVKEGTMGSGDKEVKSDVWIANADSSKPRRLTNFGSCFDPNW
jgi:Tol biopolymer transport system component